MQSMFYTHKNSLQLASIPTCLFVVHRRTRIISAPNYVQLVIFRGLEAISAQHFRWALFRDSFAACLEVDEIDQNMRD